MPYALAASPPPTILPSHKGIPTGATVAVRTAGRGGISHERVGHVVRIYQNRRGVYFEVQEVDGKLLRVHPALIRLLQLRGSE